MGYGGAHSKFVDQRNQAKASAWEISSNFDYLLSQLLAQNAVAAMGYAQAAIDSYEQNYRAEVEP